MHRGVATFTLDYGKCPRWLFERMVKLGRAMTEVIVAEYGSDEYIRRLADPVWFQSLGTVLAFDWNASGLTTILTAALKEGVRGEEKDLGVFICGGKGKTSLRTPEEITNWGERTGMEVVTTKNLVYNSKMSAKVDSSLVQDGYTIYHHSFMFSKNGACPHTKRALENKTKKSLMESQKKNVNIQELKKEVKETCDARCGVGAWTVVQQGMNTKNQSARRYHWFSENAKDLVCEPHSGVISQGVAETLNLVAKSSDKTRQISTGLVDAGYNTLMKDIELLRKHSSELHKMVALRSNKNQLTLIELENKEFKTHPVIKEDFSKSRYLEKILSKVCYEKPESYEKLLATPGVGGKTMRALALVGEVVYGANPSYEDPARYSFAHGGKDATPYAVDRKTYDKTIATMKRLVNKAKIDIIEKNKIQRRLH